MGQFASSISLSLDEILTLTSSAVTSIETAIVELGLIDKSLQPRTSMIPLPVPVPPNHHSALDLAILYALRAAYNECDFIFKATFPDVDLPVANTCYGTVLNYAPVNGNFESLTNQIAACFADWGLQPELAASIAAQLQPQVVSSSGTPTATYGRAATDKVSISGSVVTVEYLFWVAAFGIFQTGADAANNPLYAAIFSFSAAVGNLQGTIQ
jgi:hypothetical protein